MKIGIVMGSDSDMPIVQKILNVLDRFSVEYETRILSAHRTPDELAKYIETADTNGVDVFITIAGKAAHLSGVVAAMTIKPVIGVPVKTDMMGGMDSLLSMVQMPKGIPVATVGVNASENAALLAMSIGGLNDNKIQKELMNYRENMRKEVLEKDSSLTMK